jgi:hypothetical protein
MNWQQAKAQRLVDEAIVSGSDLNLTEYHSKDRYETDHPNDRPLGVHNAVVRAAMREGTRRGLYPIGRSPHSLLNGWANSISIEGESILVECDQRALA